MHTQREGRHCTALFSNTARAHKLGATRDWVIIERECTTLYENWPAGEQGRLFESA